MEACFGLGAAARLLSHRRQSQLEQEGAAKKAKSGVPVPEKKVLDAMAELKAIMLAPATLQTGKGATWNRPLVDIIFKLMDNNKELTAFVDEHAAAARRLLCKEIRP